MNNLAIRRALLACGVLSSLLYVAMNVFVAMQWDGYSSASQTVSELSAIGAPTRPLWVPLGIVYTLLVAAFGWGVWASAHRNRPLRVVGRLDGRLRSHRPRLAADAPARGAGRGRRNADRYHAHRLAMVTVLLMLLAIGFGAAAFGKRFRLYSIATMVILLAFGVLTDWTPRIQADLPTPWVGVWERINIGVFLLWVVVLATTLLRPRRHAVATGRDVLAA